MLAALSAGAIAFFYYKGCLLYYGDATAHINVARRILDSRTPGWEQVGTVWLPLPHLLMVPFVGFDNLWMTGLAGSIPCGFCFVLAGVLIFLAARRVFADGAAAATACLLLALNPNLLYLQSIPMTEAVFLACVAALLYSTVRFRETQSWGAVVAAGLAALAASMTRYEGWFLIPFVALYFLAAAKAEAPEARAGFRRHRLTRPALLVRAQLLLFRRPARILLRPIERQGYLPARPGRQHGALSGRSRLAPGVALPARGHPAVRRATVWSS